MVGRHYSLEGTLLRTALTRWAAFGLAALSAGSLVAPWSTFSNEGSAGGFSTPVQQCSACRDVWALQNEPVAPSGRLWEGLVYDAVDQEDVLFGGIDAHLHSLGDTWVYRGGLWTNITNELSSAPSPRYYPGMAWDPAIGAVVLFGGIHDPQSYSDTWTFVHDRWTNLTASVGVSPSGRSYAAMSYDSAAGDLLLFGGFNESPLQEYGDTWEFRSNRWVNLTDALPVSPPPRPDAAMADDPRDGMVILFGGDSPHDTVPFFNDTWGFHSGRWTNPTSIGSLAPSGREDPAMTYDAAGGFLLLFGGTTTPATPELSDTWTYSGGAWSNLTGTLPASPPTAGGGREAYDASTEAVLLFGGVGESGFLAQTWLFSVPGGSSPPGTSSAPSLWIVGAGSFGGGLMAAVFYAHERREVRTNGRPVVPPEQ